MKFVMQKEVEFLLVAIEWSVVLPAGAQLTIYERDDFAGRNHSTSRAVSSLDSSGINDRATSFVVQNDGWKICEGARFNGRCSVLRQGQYASLSAMGLNDRITSVRPVSRNSRVEEERYEPPPYRLPNDVAGYRPRQNERLFEADVVAVNAVVGTPEQRCWAERQQVQAQPERGLANVGDAVFGGVVGGILGSQIGGGFGKDLATIGDVAAGTAVGANVGRDNQGDRVTTRDVQRCSTTSSSARSEYWDTT